MTKSKTARKTATKVAKKAPAKRKVWKKRPATKVAKKVATKVAKKTATKKVAKKVSPKDFTKKRKTAPVFNPLATAFAVARKAVELQRFCITEGIGEIEDLSFLYKELTDCCSARSTLGNWSEGGELASQIEMQKWRHNFASILFGILEDTLHTVEVGGSLGDLKERIVEQVPHSEDYILCTL